MKFLIAILAFLIFPGYSYPATRNNIRVRIEETKDSVLLSVKSHYKIEDLNSGLMLYKGKPRRNQLVTPTNSGLRLGEKDFKVYGIRIIPRKGETLYLDDKALRGIVDIIRTKDLKLLVVNHMDIEEYLYGVLYREVPHYWPAETLKAQAVAARTFALYRKGISGGKEYDVTSDVYSQVYGGLSSEKRRTTRAVDSTRGLVLTYRGEIFPAYYHSICAGYTESGEVVFGSALAPLKGGECPYCRGAPGMNWKAVYSYREMEEALNKYGIKAEGISYIAEGKRNRSGRLEDIKIKDKKGVKEIKAYKFRLAVGPNAIRSTDFTIWITPKGVVFRGAGWGHGVGLCQWGAFGMGKRRFGYRKILEYYYPGAKVEKIMGV